MKLLLLLWTARRSNHSILKEICPGCSLKGLMLKLKLQYFGHLMWRTDSLEKTDAGKDRRQEEKGATEKEIVGWYHQLNGHEFEQTLGDGDGQGSLVCCSPWGYKESDATERLNNHIGPTRIIQDNRLKTLNLITLQRSFCLVRKYSQFSGMRM